jgi:hypothetical protein
MKSIITQQEVLLKTDTWFAQRQWADNDSPGAQDLSAIEQLEKACWEGLVKELIPELDLSPDNAKKLWLWQIHETQSFLALDFYEFPGPKQREYSIDPYLFMAERLMS